MPYLLLISASVFWGSHYVFKKLLVSAMNPYFLSFVRAGLTYILLYILYHKSIKQQWHFLTENYKINIVFALLIHVCFPLTLSIGLQSTSALNASIYLSVTPALVLLINQFIFKEHISARNVSGVIISTTGVLYLIVQGHPAQLISLKDWNSGDIWTILSALSWAFYCALLKFKDKRVSTTAFISFTSLISSPVLFILWLNYMDKTYDDMLVTSAFSWDSFAYLLYLVILPSWLAYVFWAKGVQLLGSARSEIFSHFIPLSYVLMSISLLDEEIFSYQIIASMLVICGVLCCSIKLKKREKHDNATRN